MMTGLDRWAALATATNLLAALAALVLWAAPAHSHDWYARECCSGRDCQEIDRARVRETLTGYYIDGEKWFVLRKHARASPDGAYHLCVLPSGALRCFFAPQPAT